MKTTKTMDYYNSNNNVTGIFVTNFTNTTTTVVVDEVGDGNVVVYDDDDWYVLYYDDVKDVYGYPNFNTIQVIGLLIATSITSCLSLYGSCSIIYTILFSKQCHLEFSRLYYNRFVLVVSICDIIGTTSQLFGTYFLSLQKQINH